MAEIPQHEKDYQLSHASEFNSVGVTTFVPIGMVIVGVAVGLRLWARKISHIPWMSDDYTLIAGFVSLFLSRTLSASIAWVIIFHCLGD